MSGPSAALAAGAASWAGQASGGTPAAARTGRYGGWTAPRRDVRTYMRNGREVYADTGREVDADLGSHALLWVVFDAAAWAAAIEADGDAEPGRWSRARRYIGEQRRTEAYESAARIRAEGERRDVHDVFHDVSRAEASAAELRRSHPNPGVHYEVTPITDAGACAACCCPTIYTDGRWFHHTGGFPTECTRRPTAADPDPEPERLDGELEIDTGRGSMTCGYCNRTESWAQAVLGYARLTGFHLLGIHKETNTLVVLVEATSLSGAVVHLAHHCLQITEDAHAKYAPGTVLARRDGSDDGWPSRAPIAPQMAGPR